MIASLYEPFKKWSDGKSVWLVSDTHFGDSDCTFMNPDWPMPFEHVRKIDSAAHCKNNTLICLGDCGDPKYFNMLSKFSYKVLITGNHDAGASKYRDYFDEIYTGPLVIADRLILSHEPVWTPWALNIHGHVHCAKGVLEYNGEGKLCGMNITADVMGFEPINLGELIKRGLLGDIQHIHKQAVERAKLCGIRQD